MSRFFSEVKRILPYVSPYDPGEQLLDFKSVSEEYEFLEGGGTFGILEQRLSRMHPVITYEVGHYINLLHGSKIHAHPYPDSIIDSPTRLELSGES